MVEYVKYPDQFLPLPQSNFSGSMSSPIETTKFTSGKIRRRKIGRYAAKSATMEWLFTPEEYDTFMEWWEVDLDLGTNRFEINMCSGGSGQTGVHVVQFTEDPSFSHEECNWRVSVSSVMYPYPKIDSSVSLSLYLGEDVGNFYPVYLNYLNREYV